MATAKKRQPQRRAPQPKKPEAEKEQPQKQLTKFEQRMILIKKGFSEPAVLSRLQSACMERMRHKNISAEEAINSVKNIVESIILRIEEEAKETGGGGKAKSVYLWQCSVHSIILAGLDAVLTMLPLDHRKLAHLIPRDGKVVYEPSYKGLLQRVQQLHENADVRCFMVWEKDVFEYREENGRVFYKHVPEKAFRDDFGNIVGCVAILAYTINNEPRERAERLDKAEIAKIRGKAMTQNIWSEWTGEKIKVAALRRLCKIPAARDEDVAWIERQMNKEYNLALVGNNTHPALPAPSALQNRIAQDKQRMDEVIPPDTSDEVQQGGEDPGYSGWDRETLHLKSGTVRKKFGNARIASDELHRILRTTEMADRKAILEKNGPFMQALFLEGFPDICEKIYGLLEGDGNAPSNQEADDGQGGSNEKSTHAGGSPVSGGDVPKTGDTPEGGGNRG